MKLGFIGCGNMASAILLGGIKSGYLAAEDTFVFDIDTAKTRTVADESKVHVATSLKDLAQNCDILLMGVKPNTVEAVVSELGNLLENKALVSIAVTWNYDRYRAILPSTTRFVFVMPNTPCLVGQGMALIEDKNNLTDKELNFVVGLFNSIGKAQMMKSSLMDAAGTLSGCGPAYVYMMIEALADGAVYHGVSRDVAYQLAAQMVKGAGEMVLKTGMHPGTLKDNVCSPGGTTIRGVRALEKGSFRSLLIDAVDAPLHDK